MIKQTFTVSCGILTSRILGCIVLILMAKEFGQTKIYDAFVVAFTIPNLFRDILGEGAISAAFVPIFVEYLTKDAKYGNNSLSSYFVSITFNILFLILFIITIICIIFSSCIVKIIAPGFAEEEQVRLTINLTKIMLPFLIFVCLAALVSGILNSLNNFFIPAIAPATLNIVMISCLLLFNSNKISLITILAYAVIIGGLLHLLIQIPFLIKSKVYKYKYYFSLDITHEGLKRVGILLLPRLISSAVVQINVVIGRLLASLLPAGSISALYYGHILIYLPISLIGVATATVALPKMAKEVSLSNYDKLKATVIKGLKICVFLTLPAIAGLIAVGLPIIKLLFERDQFTPVASYNTYIAVCFYAVGLLFYTSNRVLISTFFALKDTTTPLIVGIATIFFNFILSILLMDKLKHGGLALATAISSSINTFILLYLLQKKIGKINYKDTLHIFTISVIMSSLIYIICKLIISSLANYSILLQVVVSVGAGIGIFGIFFKLFGKL